MPYIPISGVGGGALKPPKSAKVPDELPLTSLLLLAAGKGAIAQLARGPASTSISESVDSLAKGEALADGLAEVGAE
jgi:hypothetical protein